MFFSLLKKSSVFIQSSKQLIRGSALFFLMNIAGVILNFLFAMIAGNNYGSAVWGQFTICLTVLQIAGVICRIGLDTLIIRFAAEEHSKNIGKVKDIYIKAASIIFVASSFVFCILFFLSDVIAIKVFNNAEISAQLKITALAIIPMNLLFLNSETMKGIKFPAASSFFRNASNWVIAFPLLFFATYFFKKELITEIYVAAVILSWLASVLFLLKFISFFKTVRVIWMNYKSIIKQGIPMMLSNSLIYLMVWIDTLMLGIFRTEAEVGIYNIAFRISMFLTLSYVAITAIAAPEFATYNSKSDRDGLQNAIGKANRLIFWTTFPAALAIILFSTPILGVFGNEFSEGSIALLLLITGRFFFSLSGSRGIILAMIGKQNVDQYISMTIVVIDIILNLIFIPLWGINGAAFSTMVTTIIWTIITVVYLRKAMKINALYIPFLGKFLEIK